MPHFYIQIVLSLRFNMLLIALNDFVLDILGLKTKNAVSGTIEESWNTLSF